MRTDRQTGSRPWILFHISSFSSNASLLADSVFNTLHPGASCFLHRLWLVLNCHLYIFASGGALTFKSESSPYFCQVSEGGHIRFWWFHTCADYLGPPFFFTHFNFLYSFTRHYNECFGMTRCRLSVCFSYSFFSLIFRRNLLYNLYLPYQVAEGIRTNM